MGFVLGAIALVGVAFWAALGAHIGGRILFPELGLTPPEYWIWFWYIVVVGLFSAPLYFLKELFK